MKLKIFLTALAILAAGIQLHAESVFIKDGSIIQGSIVSDTADTITMYTTEKKTVTIQRSRIMRILYTELYMGKIFVNLIDGSVIEVYMVDENRDTFTFRKDLYKPEELVVKREDVLFTTRTNPVGLKGEADRDSISIDWRPPYTAVKHYRVYIKSDGQYKLYSEPSGKSETLKGLKSNTEYKIKVTAMGKDGVESTPSNEITIKTLNMPPDPPEKIKIARKVDKDGKTMNVILSWDTSTDIDGKIKSYKIHRMDNDEVYTSNKPEYEVKNLNPQLIYSFRISSIDDSGAESVLSDTVKIVNIPPYPPRKIKITRKPNTDGRTMSAILSWDDAKDNDGRIRSYTIYQKGKQGAFTTYTTEYEIKNLDNSAVYFFNISSIDDCGDESDKSVMVSTYDYKWYDLIVKADYIYPLGKFADVHEYGYGCL